MDATQLTFDAADRLVELVEERGPVGAEEAARALFALAHVPGGLARSLLDDVVGGDARLAWRGGAVGLVDDPAEILPIEAASYVVVDLETTGLRPGRAAICEIGAVRLEGLERVGAFQTLVDPGVPLPPVVTSLTGIESRDLSRAPSPREAVSRFLDFSAGAVLVAHNARFDIGFLDREVEAIEGRRLAAPVLDTVGLARRLLAGRVARASLGSLAHFFGTSVRPCHRALPDAEATAEILLRLIGLAQERRARTVADLARLGAPRVRRVYDKRGLAFGAPPRPGVYSFVGKGGQVLYVGRARNLRERLRSYFRSERQRPAVEAALAAVERIEWRVLGSELEAALEELRLIREQRPPANARSVRPDRYLYLARRGDRIVVTPTPSSLGPIRSRRRAELAARALQGASEDELELLPDGGPLPRLRAKLADLAGSLRYEDAARLRDRIAALEQVVADLAELERLRAARLCLIAPAVDDGFRRAFFVSGGRVAAVRTLPRGPGARIELEAGLVEARTALPSLAPEAADELLLVGSFLRRPPPELEVVRLAELESGYAREHERTPVAAGDAR
ncbi:MAG TPA: exonuclease domain-containing protein [Gaiellaceae bacterium]|nr:exonuclease domain-containing protein [Gaiellaceae bacterium]